MINYDKKLFKAVSVSKNGQVNSDTEFYYMQDGEVIFADYSGGEISKGYLVGTVDEVGVIEMSYHHIDNLGNERTGVCRSTPEILSTGKIRLHEKWKWTNGDESEGESIVEEV